MYVVFVGFAVGLLVGVLATVMASDDSGRRQRPLRLQVMRAERERRTPPPAA